MNKPHTLICVLGKTAAGKDELVNRLCTTTKAKQLISYTTRLKRIGEGNTHIFVDETKYFDMLDAGSVAVDTNIAGNYYWSTIDQLYESDIYIVDYLGYKKLKEMDLPGIKLVSVFINTPDELRRDRALNKRKDDKSKFLIRDRLEKKQFEDMLKSADFDYSIQNIRFPEAYSVFKWIAMAEGVPTQQNDLKEGE